MDHEPLQAEDLVVSELGERRIDSPVERRQFTPDKSRVQVEIDFVEGETEPMPIAFEKAGPREHVYFNAADSRAAIVTCGGLCPGLNNVIRHLYYTLTHTYGVPSVLGIQHGYLGLTPAGLEPLELTADWVEAIHHQGGTMLGTSRGHQDPAVMVDFLIERRVNLLFAIGGDGTQHGAHVIAAQAQQRGVDLAVVGIPKTIDNDIQYCFQTFGFASAVAEAERVIDRAHVEAKSVQRGVGIVKLMGREAGFIAAAATIASGEVNFCLVPEAQLTLEGESGFLAKLERRLDARGHAVIVVAEGAGQELLRGPHVDQIDQSGNRRLGDIGTFLKTRIDAHFTEIEKPVGIKYLDPSYYIRSVAANATDSILTERFARHAVHAAMAGKTDLFVGYWNGRIVHVPLVVSAGKKRRMAPDSELWTAVLEITGQDVW